ncbi:hypothetical protein [Pontibacter harenae]|uniref:hypothetical protein n=1 Tax=Pontibacter harenae TaxID=2894083 RepID=UPI001E473E30|nr:hypothetical protein [Pontibacter harenae]MCC9165289.1 hypothetical protein [Pontibacter harenae]
MKKLFYVVAALGVLFLTFYTYIGGFTEPDVTVATSEIRYVAGQPFLGSTDDRALGKVFQRAAEVLDKKELEGMLGSIYYNNPVKKGDTISAFIGVIIPDTTVQLPEGYELRVVPGNRKVLRGQVKAHYSLAPSKLYNAVFDYAKEENMELEQFYLEWFPQDDEAMLEVPVKQ